LSPMYLLLQTHRNDRALPMGKQYEVTLCEQRPQNARGDSPFRQPSRKWVRGRIAECPVAGSVCRVQKRRHGLGSSKTNLPREFADQCKPVVRCSRSRCVRSIRFLTMRAGGSHATFSAHPFGATRRLERPSFNALMKIATESWDLLNSRELRIGLAGLRRRTCVSRLAAVL
jgi:hypothetical protein